ncbi:EpsG family protein [Empedobacter stercoris]|uniref:EpsG family protein n=1 Tax=Empedobacter stercoris TaxID=1628248 RepID=A0ABX1WMB3_9FLAO|nr:EpsG family protein [Empedobacter stercoris]NOJ75677.1 EpsG family protein [Empedobacter stercoris]
MIYIVVLLLSLLILYLFYKGKPSKYSFLVATLFVSTIWVIIIGSQDSVGTDYTSYISIFSNKNYLEYYKDVKAEYLFYYIVKLSNYLSLNGQNVFYVFIALTSFLFFKIVSLINKKEVVTLTYLFITVSTLFHYQMNGLRQSVAVFFITLAILYYIRKNRLWFIIFALCGILMHKSSFIVIPVFLLLSNNRILFFLEKYLIGILITTSVLCLLPFDNVIEKLLGFTGVFKEVANYSNYAESDYVQRVSIVNKLSKLVYLPIYLYIVHFFYKQGYICKLSDFERRMLIIGVVSFSIKNLFLISSITNRIGLFFLLFSIFPVMLLFKELKNLKYNANALLAVIIIYINVLYFFKVVVFPYEVYSYQSVLFSL